MPHTNDYQVTTNEIMDYLKENMVTRGEFNEFKIEVDERFEKIDERFEKTDQQIGKLQSDMIDHIDRQLLALRGDFVVIMRSEDRKLGALIDLLAMKNVITKIEARSITNMEPFPQIA